MQYVMASNGMNSRYALPWILARETLICAAAIYPSV